MASDSSAADPGRSSILRAVMAPAVSLRLYQKEEEVWQKDLRS